MNTTRGLLVLTLGLVAALCLSGPAAANPNPQATTSVQCDVAAGTASATGSTSGFSPKQHNLSATLTLLINGNVVDTAQAGPYSGPGTTLSVSAGLPQGAGSFVVQSSVKALGGTGALMASASDTVTCERDRPPPPCTGDECEPPPFCETHPDADRCNDEPPPPCTGDECKPPPDQHFCVDHPDQCGELPETDTGAWYETPWKLAGVLGILALALIGGGYSLAVRRRSV